jgi:hypothetical protein
MNSTTAPKRVSFSRILLLSAALQAAGLLLFYAVEPLRKTRLAAGEPKDARTLDRAAEARLRAVEAQRKQQRERTALKRPEAETLSRKEARRKAADITAKLKDMKVIRDQLAEDEAALMREVAAREVDDVGLHFFGRIHPLATQLVVHARGQRAELPLPSAPAVADASAALRAVVDTERERVLQPPVFERLRAAHRAVQDAQQQFITQLDDAQRAYAGDQARIRRENHTEYQVNLMRDRIAELLGEVAELDVTSMNDLPEDYQAPPPLSPGWEEQLADQSVPELHQEAQALHEDIRTLFAGARAAQMALEQHAALAAAFEKVNVPGPPSTFDAGGLAAPPQSVGELNSQIAELGRAAGDVTRLWQSAHNMGAAGRAMAGHEAPAPGGPPGGSGTGRAAGARGVAAAHAAGGQGGRFADMTPFMYHSGVGEKGFGSTVGGGIDITHKSIRSGYAETGSGTPGAKGPPLLSEAKVLKEALPGRTFSRSSPRTGWLYLDTWYVIGPWENRARIGFADSQPPETLVDLDATYPGKDGRTLSWQFFQSDNIRVKPPLELERSTYYGYTEVYFEEQTEMLVAVASDDAAKVWLNGQLIWQDDGLSPWRLDEGFRKVVFRQGFNTILLRIENGPITCTYSLLLCPPEVLL